MRRDAPLVTQHAWKRIKGRIKPEDPCAFARALDAAIRAGRYTLVIPCRGGKTMVRAMLPDGPVYALLGHSQIVMSLFLPGMLAFTPWGNFPLPPHPAMETTNAELAH